MRDLRTHEVVALQPCGYALREPDLRLKLTPQEYATKKAAIIDHTLGTSPVHDGLVQEYLKPEDCSGSSPSDD